MSVSVQSYPSDRPVNRFDFGSRMDTAKFTAVNGSFSHPDVPKSFTFRPEPTANLATNGTSPPTEAINRGSSTSNGHGPGSPPRQHPESRADSHSIYDNITLAKRKRSPEGLEDDEPERRSSTETSSSVKMPRVFHEHDILNGEPDSAGHNANRAHRYSDPYESESVREHTPSNKSWDGSTHGQPQATSPDETDLAESLQRDIARHDSTVEHSTDSHQSGGFTNHEAGKPTKSSPKRADDTGRETKKRAFTHRTKTGCMTCRKRKKKCDEHKPVCLNCTKGSFKCEGYEEDKVVAIVPTSGGRARASTQSSTSSFLAPYPATRPGWTDYEPVYRTKTSPEPRAAPDHIASAPRFGWGRPLWLQDASPNSLPPAKPAQVGPASHTGSPRSEPFLNFTREQQRVAHESLIHTARLGTAIAPAPGPNEDRSTPVAPPPMAPLTHTLPMINTSPLSHSSPLAPSALISRGAPMTAHAAPTDMNRMSQRERMLSGLSYHHWNDPQLIDDRNDCKAALERYNKAVRPSQGTSEEERGRLFKAIVKPELRRNSPNEGRPTGHLGHFLHIEAPFHCEYGYNLRLHDDVVIEANCFMQDPCPITIGKRTVIGPNVQFYGRTLPTDMRARGGIRGLAIGAPITVEDDCYIGGGCIITPGVRIGRGSVILPGSTVDKDVPSGVECGGSPLQIIRGISMPADNSNHNPHRHDGDDVASLMMRDRSYPSNGR